MQLPDAGEVLDPGTDRVRLVLAVAIDQVPTVTMPSLIGLSADEVATVLNQLGLVLGRTTVRSLEPIG
jgi:beta-lactam-binding protein with PASTA domain